jgi:hypothetical protein
MDAANYHARAWRMRSTATGAWRRLRRASPDDAAQHGLELLADLLRTIGARVDDMLEPIPHRTRLDLQIGEPRRQERAGHDAPHAFVDARLGQRILQRRQRRCSAMNSKSKRAGCLSPPATRSPASFRYLPPNDPTTAGRIVQLAEALKSLVGQFRVGEWVTSPLNRRIAVGNCVRAFPARNSTLPPLALVSLARQRGETASIALHQSVVSEAS